MRKKIFENKLFLFIMIIYLLGFLVGISFHTKIDLNTIDFKSISFLQIFFSNYWYLFVIWLLGMSIIGLICIPFILFFRGLVHGVYISLLFKMGWKIFFLYFFTDLIFISTSLLILSYFSYRLSIIHLSELTNHSKNYFNLKQYINLMVYIIIILVIYSIIISRIKVNI